MFVVSCNPLTLTDVTRRVIWCSDSHRSYHVVWLKTESIIFIWTMCRTVLVCMRLRSTSWHGRMTKASNLATVILVVSMRVCWRCDWWMYPIRWLNCCNRPPTTLPFVNTHTTATCIPISSFASVTYRFVIPFVIFVSCTWMCWFGWKGWWYAAHRSTHKCTRWSTTVYGVATWLVPSTNVGIVSTR